MLELYLSLFPVWFPDSWAYGLLGVFLGGCMLILFPPARRSRDGD